MTEQGLRPANWGRALKTIVFGLVLSWLVAMPGPAIAADPVCRQVNEDAGRGARVIEICTAGAIGFDSAFDAYYRVAVEVTPGPGFGGLARFDRGSTQGRILRGFLSLFADMDRTTTTDVGISIRQGNLTYPRLSLITFRKVNNNEWSSTIRADARSIYHRLTGSEPFNITLNYAYSRTTSFDLSPGTRLLDSLGLNIANATTKPLLDAAAEVSRNILQAGDITSSDSSYGFSLSPDENRRVSIRFQITDPRTSAVIANVRLSIEGTRSLFFAGAREHAAIQNTLPAGIVRDVALNGLVRQIATGQAQNWDLPNATLATASMTAIPIWKEPNETDIRTFCSSVASGLTTNYSLTSFDSLIVRANLLSLAAEPIKSRINPYRLCFGSEEDRATIRARLGIDTEYVIARPVVAPALAPVTDFETLYRFGCFLTGKMGPRCMARDATPLRVAQSLAETVSAETLEGVRPELSAGLPEDRVMPAAGFVERFGGRFFSFGDIVSASGSMHIQEVEGGPTLKVRLEQGPDGKVRRVSIRQ